MEKWLTERRYSEKLVGKKIVKANTFSKETLSDEEKALQNDCRVTFDITYYSFFKNFRVVALDENHKRFFADIPIIGINPIQNGLRNFLTFSLSFFATLV